MVKEHSYGFFSVVCWFADNFFCNYLQTLPFNIPYLHLHAFGWHIGVTLAIHYWHLTLVLHRIIIINKYKHEQLQFKSIFGLGLFVYVKIKNFNKKNHNINNKLKNL